MRTLLMSLSLGVVLLMSGCVVVPAHGDGYYHDHYYHCGYYHCR